MAENRVRVLAPVDFHGRPLTVVDKDGEPYVAMKPIVEGMGLDWKGQYVKLRENAARWRMEIISIVHGGDGKMREMSCMPLRKLPGWLATINPRKVNPEIAPLVILFQDGADDALWAAYNKQRGALADATTALSRDEIVAQMAQSIVDKERRLAAVEQQVPRIAGRVEAIEKRSSGAQLEMLGLPEPEGPVAGLTKRTLVSRALRGYCMNNVVAFDHAFMYLYREYRDRYGIDLPKRGRNIRKSPIEMAELMGDVTMTQLYDLAHLLFVKRPVAASEVAAKGKAFGKEADA